MPTARLLLLEDSPGESAPISEELARAMPEIQILAISNLRDLSQAFQAGEFDLMVSDSQLKWTGALAVLQEVKARRPECPVIFYARSATLETAVEAMKRGARDYIPRGPQSVARLVATIRATLSHGPGSSGADAFYRGLLDGLPVGVFRSTPEGRLLEVNKTFLDIFGYPDRDTALATPITAFYADPDKRARGKSILVEQGRLHNQQAPGRRRDGSVVWVELNVHVVRNAEGRILFFEGTVEDISERRKAEQDLRQSQLRFEMIARATQDALWDWDLVANRMWWNEGITAFGYRAGSVEPGLQWWEDRLHPEDRRRVAAGLNAVLGAGSESWTDEYRFRKENGEYAYVLDRGYVMHDEQGRPVRMVGAIVDLTMRRRAEEAVRESEQRYRTLFEGNPQPMWLTDPDALRFLAVNDAAVAHYGYSRSEFLTMTLKDIRPAEDVPALLEEIAASAGVDTYRGGVRRHRKKDGSLIDVEITFHTMEIGGRCVRLVLVNDITERKRAEEALRESEFHYRLLFENNPQPMYVFDQETLRFLAVNNAAVRHYGYSHEEFLEMTVLDIRPPDEAAIFADSERRLRHHDDRSGLWKHRRKDGSVIDVRIDWYPLAFEGRPASLVLAMDVTEQHRAEEALRQSEQRYRLLFEGSPMPAWVVDLETHRFLAVNEAAVRLYGYSRDEFLSMTTQEIRPAEDVPALLEYLDAIRREQGRMGAAGIWRHRKKDGTLIDAQIAWHSIEFAGRPAELVLVNDVTERLRTEAALRLSEERYRDLYENANDLLYTHDLDGNFTSLNRAGELLTGYSREEALRMNLADVVAPEHLSAARQWMAGLPQGGTPATYEIDILAKDGQRLTLEVSTRLIYEDGKPAGVQGIARNVTERRQLEGQLRQASRMEAVGQLAGGVAHDFNNLLGLIIGYSELLLEGLAPVDPRRKNAEEIREAGRRAAALTRQLLAFSRRQMLQPEVLNLNAVVERTSSMLRRLIGEHIDLVTSLSPDLGAVLADPGQIEQVLMNLAINARDAMPEGGQLTIETANAELDGSYTWHHPPVNPGPYVMLAVSDTGMGMDEHVRAHIFEPFFTTKEKGKGTGLGLATVYGVVKQSGGFIWVYSEPTRGSSFKIYLPQAVEHSAASPGKESQSQIRAGQETLLLVEDEDALRRLTGDFLESCGYSVLTAANGDEALGLLDDLHDELHLLVTDVVMPGMSGRQLAERVVAARPKTRVLYLSGYTHDAIHRHGVLEPGIDFLPKPFQLADLARKVREVLDKEPEPSPQAIG